MAISANDFLDKWSGLLANIEPGPVLPGQGRKVWPRDGSAPGRGGFASHMGDLPYEIAANVSVPNPTGEQNTVYMDYPSLPDVNEGGYKALGSFGDTTDEYKDYGFTTTQPGFGDLIRGQMNFIEGGIPASATFNREESLKAYPEQMQGIPEGNMPVFRHW